MKTKEEMLDLYRKMRDAQGNMKNAIDIILEEAECIEAKTNKAYQSGYEKGFNDGCNFEACKSTYEDGLNDAWEAARKVFSAMNIDEIVDVFGGRAAANNESFFMMFSAQEAIEKLRIYEAQNPNNAQKFVEVFGFMPGFSLTEDGEPVLPALDCKWWDAPYKEPEK